ncbi:hypothetical protein ColTof4_01156 [Colletotrichum tofieldiae]|nr:hypothetical protein ColTof3_08382 [Colletotrichum tofieldiae]GKT68733.1 hypothetical protein ColTof4_01156 [Colletotrichum tofieldiae]GKT96751.1 hypothetical protein Ct61P_14601 [Colletotrichum tofieldiae]
MPKHDSTIITASDPNIGLSKNSFYIPEDRSERRYGPVPSFQDVFDIVHISQYGMKEAFDETCWDREVHFRILSLALRHSSVPIKDGLVNFTALTAAAIHTNFMKDTPGQMVNFCVYIDPKALGLREPAIATAVNHVRSISGYSSVNHTSLFHLRNKPISLSMKSKQRHASLDDAHLHIGTWHAAQWIYSERLVSQRGAVLQRIASLPGLIVQAEDWHFMASTLEGILWSKKIIGSTSDLEGAYQVIRVIQYLAWWTEAAYWPWYLSTVLGLGIMGDKPQAANT